MYTPGKLRDAIQKAEKGTEPIKLLAEQRDDLKTVELDYHGGLQYPHLELVEGTPGSGAGAENRARRSGHARITTAAPLAAIDYSTLFSPKASKLRGAAAASMTPIPGKRTSIFPSYRAMI